MIYLLNMTDNKEEKKLEINKPSGLVQITNRPISLLQRKVYNVLIFNAYPDMDQDIHKLRLKELKNLLSYHDFETLKKEVLELMKIVVEMNYIGDRDKTVWEAYSLLPYVKAVGDDEIEYSFGLLKEKFKSPEFYAKISLIIQKKFKSKYTLALYEFCCDHFIRQKGFGITPWIPVEDLKELLGCEKNTEFKFFKRDILSKSVKEINEKSDLIVTIKFKRRDKSVSSIQFIIYPGEKSKYLKELFCSKQPELSDEENPELLSRLVNEFKVNELLARDVLKRFKQEHIESTLSYIEKRKEKIKDLGAYTYSMITDEKVKILTPGGSEKRTQTDVPDGAIVEINGKEYKYEDGFVKIDKMHSIPEAKLKQMIVEGKAVLKHEQEQLI